LIADMPTAAANSVEDVAQKIKAFVHHAHAIASDGLTLAEFGELATALMRVAIAAADSIPVAGADRKAWVLEAVGLLFDSVADKLIPTVAWPVWVILRPAARSLLLHIADGAIESLLPLVRLDR
jgi:hypothetical protein